MARHLAAARAHHFPAVPGGLLLTVCAVLAGAGAAVPGRAMAATRAGRPAAADFATLASAAVATLEREYYTGAGTWNMCVPAGCRVKNSDWGADSLTYTLYLHWALTRDRRVVPIARTLTGTAPQYGARPGSWSDVPMWNSIADVRDYQMTGSPGALHKAEAAFASVASAGRDAFAAGACPAIDYQQRGGGTDHLKTLETDSNYVKAAILLYQQTGRHGYLTMARAKYAAARRYFLSRGVPLYTVYVFDNGRRCSALRARYFASVNGNMIWNGAELAAVTKDQDYLAEAIATARAVRRYLSDAAGVFADLQAENDVVEPLVEAMYLLATSDDQAFARDWLLRSAAAAAGDVTSRGTYGRFFDGPPPTAPVTAWQVNGGLSLMIAAAALDPTGAGAARALWHRAVFVRDGKWLPARGGAVRIRFTGRAIAIIGTLGEHCCQTGHATVSIDGRPLTDRTGIWQDESSAGRSIPGAILFAWRWPGPGTHTITVGPARYNPKEGGTFFHMTGYELVR